MAGDWIAMRTCLAEEPEVVSLADVCGIDEHAVVGRLHALWSWADHHTSNGNAPSVTDVTAHRFIDRKVALQGFAEALVTVGWLVIDDAGLTFPNFDRHNGSTAKTRALSRKRVQKHRANSCNAPSVTKALPQKRTEQNRRTKEEVVQSDSRSAPASEFSFQIKAKGGGTWSLPQAKVDEYAQTYGCRAGVLMELRKIRQWCSDNPAKRKTASGMLRFITTWLNKANDDRRFNDGDPVKRPTPSTPVVSIGARRREIAQQEAQGNA